MTLRTLPSYCADHQLQQHLLQLLPDDIAGRPSLSGDCPASRWLSHVFGAAVAITPILITVNYDDSDTLLYATPIWLQLFQIAIDRHEGEITAEEALEILADVTAQQRRAA